MEKPAGPVAGPADIRGSSKSSKAINITREKGMDNSWKSVSCLARRLVLPYLIIEDCTINTSCTYKTKSTSKIQDDYDGDHSILTLTI